MLETYFGRFEEVEVEQCGNKFYFHNGWKKFVEINDLETGDFLVFKYFEHDSKFKVKIFGKTCCEKKYGMVSGKEDMENVHEKRKGKRDVVDGNKEDMRYVLEKRKRKRDVDDEEDNGIEDGESKSKAFKKIIIDIDSSSSQSDDDYEGNGIGKIQFILS